MIVFLLVMLSYNPETAMVIVNNYKDKDATLTINEKVYVVQPAKTLSIYVPAGNVKYIINQGRTYTQDVRPNKIIQIDIKGERELGPELNLPKKLEPIELGPQLEPEIGPELIPVTKKEWPTYKSLGGRQQKVVVFVKTPARLVEGFIVCYEDSFLECFGPTIVVGIVNGSPRYDLPPTSTNEEIRNKLMTSRFLPFEFRNTRK